jgi:hypothetical protein
MMSNHSRSSSSLKYLVRARLALSALVLCACSADIVSVPPDGRSQAITAAPGQGIDITLSNVGPAIYASPPMISSAAVTYLSVDVAPPYNPGGPTQRFRFRAVSSGQAVIRFQRELGDAIVSVVEDTVRVR